MSFPIILLPHNMETQDTLILSQWSDNIVELASARTFIENLTEIVLIIQKIYTFHLFFQSFK